MRGIKLHIQINLELTKFELQFEARIMKFCLEFISTQSEAE